MSTMSQRLQQLLAQPEFAGIYHVPHSDRKALRQAARALGFGWMNADFAESRDIVRILEKLGPDLRLPEWYGGNYDALSDCLTDLSWNAAPGYVLLVTGADELHAHDQRSFDIMNEVLTSIVDNWRGEQVPFWVFYDMRPNGLANLPIVALG